MNEQSQFSALQTLLSQQEQLLTDLQLTIANELDAVKRRAGNDINEIAPQKEALLNKITETDQHIAASLTSDIVKDALISDPELSASRTRITDLLEACQTQNEVVYLTAKQNEVAIEQVKNLLIGGSKNTTYDAYGQTKSGPSLYKGVKA